MINQDAFKDISKEIIESYIGDKDWRTKESSSCTKSIGALGKYITGEVSKNYWLQHVYNPVNLDIAKAYREGFMHIHDLNVAPTLYCCGYSLQSIIDKGVKGVPNIAVSSPAKHFMAIINQLCNLTTVFQNEIAGAVAFSSVDTLLAPYIKEDNLTYKEVKQHLQNYIYSLNSNSRCGAEPAFTNITLDLTPPDDLLNKEVVIAGVPKGYTYKDCQKEMDMFNKAFCELMIAGDAGGNPFAYPIPTYNIHKRFDWDNPNNELLWEMAGKYGTPYFANFINSDMDPSEARSMCCRLRLDLRELRRRSGGLFGSGDSTGSIGVVTINLPRLAYIAKKSGAVDKKKVFYQLLDHYMDLAKESLEIKRKYLQENVLDGGLIPAFKEYVGTLDNHFSTIGLVGMNEMCVNLLGVDITDEAGRDFSLDVLDYMRNRLSDYQVETGNFYNLEATPAESTCYRLARKDREDFGSEIFTQFNGDPYYTNSCHIPVKSVEGIKQLFDHQDELQCKFTGGTVVHMYLEGSITGNQAKHLVRTICEQYKLPYISLSPLVCTCPEHGLSLRKQDTCPICGKPMNYYQRITGYIRPVRFDGEWRWNPGKLAEFRDRNMIKM